MKGGKPRGAACAAVLMTLALASGTHAQDAVAATRPVIQLDFRPLPRDEEGRQNRPRLEIRHAALGFAAEMQCYETGPFQMGKTQKDPDGSVVFSYKSGEMTCTTTFTTPDDERVAMDVLIQGPLEQLRKVAYVGPCLQFRRADAFTWRPDLVEFGRRCFVYTMRGPLGCHDMPRALLTNFKPDAKQNNPPVTQLYVPIDQSHHGSIWGHTAAPGMRALYGIMTVTSHDGKWLCAIGNRHNLTIGQLWMPCTHYVPDVQKHLDRDAGRIAFRTMIYVMPNDPRKLLEAFRRDYADAFGANTFEAVPDAAGTLRLKPTAAGVPELELVLDVADAVGVHRETPAPTWKSTYWGTFVRSGPSWRMWAHPHDDALDLVVSFASDGWKAETARAAARLAPGRWQTAESPAGVPAQVLKSPDGKWTAALFWEKSENQNPRFGIPGSTDKTCDAISVRGRLLIFQGDPDALGRRWQWAAYDWKNAYPYCMPVADNPQREEER